MRIDKYGQQIYTEDDLCNMYMRDPERSINHIYTETPIIFSEELELTNPPIIYTYVDPQIPIDEYDTALQSIWRMPDSYKDLDIAKYVLDLCTTDAELQRVAEELLLFQERDMFDLLRYLKYLVDTMREHNVIWGVGRGSSVASFVLFLIGVHKINSLYYDLPIEEFLK